MGSHLLSDCQNTEEGKCEWVSQPTCIDNAVMHVTLLGHFPRPGLDLGGA